MRRVLRIVLVEDQGMFRDLVGIQTERMGSVIVGEAATAERGLRLIEAHEPDLALVDLGLPDANGIELLAAARRLGVRTRLVVLSVSTDPATIEAALRAGADGYVDKGIGSDELFGLLERVMAGEHVLSRRVQSAIGTPGPPSGSLG